MEGPVDIPAPPPGEWWWDYNSIPIEVSQTGNIDLRYLLDYQADITVTLSYDVIEAAVSAVLCPPGASIPDFPTGYPRPDDPFDDICVEFINVGDFPWGISACDITDMSFTDLYPDDTGRYIWEIPVTCPIVGGVYPPSSEFFWSGLIDDSPTGGESINGTWRMWLGSDWDGDGTDLGDFSEWTLDICSANLVP